MRIALPLFARSTLRGAPGLVLALFAGCVPQEGGPDAGDSGPPPVPTVCDEDAVQELVLDGATAAIELDTSLAEARPLDMGLACGNPEAPKFAKQVVVKLTIPGEGPKSVNLSTRNGGTSREFITFVQVRRDCEKVPPATVLPTCFGPTNSDVRAAGRFAATGGETVYLFVTGYADAPGKYIGEGPLRLLVSVEDGNPPTLDEATASWLGEALEVSATIADTNRNILGVSALLLDADGRPVDVNGDGKGDESDALVQDFGTSANNRATFTGTFLVNGARTQLTALGVRKARIQAFDATFLLSAPLDVTIEDVPLKKLDETCTAADRCALGLDCTEGVCTAPAAVTSACEAATPIVLPGSPADRAQGTVTGVTILGGQGLVTASCGNTAGREAIYSLEIPDEGTYDIIARTNVSGTATNVDTVVYLRNNCEDSSTELVCNDEAASNDSRSMAVAYDVPGESTYFILTEVYGGIASGNRRYNLSVTVRPVLPSGADCDPEETRNRCAKAHCLIATKKCP